MTQQSERIELEGRVEYRLDGELHREDGPAIECEDGDKEWYKNNKLHREDGPAVEFSNGDKFWYLNGELHREDGPAIEYANGTKKWYLNGQLHREDGPAVEWAGGSKFWYKNGKLHREDGPAIECTSGDKAWWLNGEELTEEEWKKQTQQPKKIVREDRVEYRLNGVLHREDGPAVERVNGTKYWCQNGKLHREGGPSVEYANGSKEWWMNDQLHREDGPAVERANGSKEWWINGQRHREDGPAVERANGYKAWSLNGEQFTEEEFKELTKSYRRHVSLSNQLTNKETIMAQGVQRSWLDNLELGNQQRVSFQGFPQTFWVVTKPQASSTEEDICFETNILELMVMVKGGLSSTDVCGVYVDERTAKEEAEELLSVLTT